MNYIDHSNIESFSHIRLIKGNTLMCRIKLKNNPNEILTHEKYLSDFCKEKLYNDYITLCLKFRTKYEW